MKCMTGEPKYPQASKVVKAALALSHGNAEVERVFSASRRYLTEDRASLSEKTVNAVITVKDTMKLYDNKQKRYL